MGAGQTTEEESPQVEKKETLEHFLKRATSGDIVLFSGSGNYSNGIKSVSYFTIFTHVGIIIRKSPTEAPLLLESTLETTPYDTFTKSYKSGVKLVDVREKIEKYGGYAIAYRKLHTGGGKGSHDIREKWTSVLLEFAEKNIHKPYEQDMGQLVGSVFGANTEEDTSSFFCTELVAKALIVINVIIESAESTNNYKLVDFASNGLFIREPYSFGKLRFIQ